MISRLTQAVSNDGYARIAGAAMGGLLGAEAAGAWAAFAATWNDLPEDGFMADGGRYRRRRFGVFSAAPGALIPCGRQPHYQDVDHNRLNGGVQRWFEPISEAASGSAVTKAAVKVCLDVFGPLRAPKFPWRLELHQFRIEARTGQPGQPTPEGVHRDGVDWVMVMLVARENIAAGVTGVYDARGRTLGAFTLADPMDAMFIDDARVFHGVTAVEPADPSQPAYRDVLVATFRTG